MVVIVHESVTVQGKQPEQSKERIDSHERRGWCDRKVDAAFFGLPEEIQKESKSAAVLLLFGLRLSFTPSSSIPTPILLLSQLLF